jgi:hypothetical protein
MSVAAAILPLPPERHIQISVTFGFPPKISSTSLTVDSLSVRVSLAVYAKSLRRQLPDLNLDGHSIGVLALDKEDPGAQKYNQLFLSEARIGKCDICRNDS